MSNNNDSLNFRHNVERMGGCKPFHDAPCCASDLDRIWDEYYSLLKERADYHSDTFVSVSPDSVEAVLQLFANDVQNASESAKGRLRVHYVIFEDKIQDMACSKQLDSALNYFQNHQAQLDQNQNSSQLENQSLKINAPANPQIEIAKPQESLQPQQD